MNAYLNYVIEANVALILFLAAYLLILRKECDFKVQRIFLLTAIVMSLTFPLLHLQWNGPSMPPLSRIMQSYFLDEVVVIAQDGKQTVAARELFPTPIQFIQTAYVIGLFFFLFRFFVWLISVVVLIRRSRPLSYGELKVIESNKPIPTFSFFNRIVIGRADMLSLDEKQNILQHEAVHANQFHSFDILLINLIAVFFWFNPILKIYKKIFVQLHEFEADARAVENRDVNEYCSLLAKVALESAGFKLANHFSNSLTLKRIKMIRTIKKKIDTWKILAAASFIPLVFFAIACQDQVANEVAAVAKSSTIEGDIPAEVQQKYDELTLTNPNKRFLLMETDENANPILDVNTKKLQSLSQSQIGHIEFITPTVKPSEAVRTFAIVEYAESGDKTTDRSKLNDDVYKFVEDMAMPRAGMGGFYEHIAKEIRYPLPARQRGIEGKVFVTFIVDTDGSINVTGVSGIGGGCEIEAMRVVQSSPAWTPATHRGIRVKQEIVLPITFTLAGSNRKDETRAPHNAIEQVVVAGYPQ